jgi:hypothetical protein
MNRAMRRKAAKKPATSARPLAAQTCVLWVPKASGYLSWFRQKDFHVVGCSNLAAHYRDEEASRMAVAFREATGIAAEVRVYVPHSDEGFAGAAS